MVSEDLNWAVKEKYRFNVETGMVKKIDSEILTASTNTIIKWEVLV